MVPALHGNGKREGFNLVGNRIVKNLIINALLESDEPLNRKIITSKVREIYDYKNSNIQGHLNILYYEGIIERKILEKRIPRHRTLFHYIYSLNPNFKKKERLIPLKTKILLNLL